MARNRASMREGPLAELFRATEAAQTRRDTSRCAGRGSRRAELRSSRRARASPRTQRRPSHPKRLRRTGARSASPRPSGASRAGSSHCPIVRHGSRASARQRLLPRGDPRRRRRRRRPERARPDDRRRHHAGRLRRGQHGHPAAPDERRADQDPHRQRAHRRTWLWRRSRSRSAGRGRELRPAEAHVARLRHGLRHRR